jgi:glucose/mannose-6-phosphate isomerase
MVNLDDLEIYPRLDPANMISQLHGLPQQCLDAWNKAINFRLPEDYADIDKLVISGMGGSAVGGDLLKSLTAFTGKPIIFVNRDYDLPAFVDSKTLVIASSYSGNTEETLTSFNQALSINCKKLAITTGGKLKSIAEAARVPVFPINHISQPRSALGYSFIPLTAFLRNLGFLEGISVDIEALNQTLKSMLLLELNETVTIDSNPAKRLAVNLHGKVPVIYCTGGLSGVARRWKTQVNENSKTWSFYEAFPELKHNAIAGYRFPSKLASEIYVILLFCTSLHSRILTNYQITSEILEQNHVRYQMISSKGDDMISQMMSLIFMGDWTSYYLAILNKIDPTPVISIDHLKKRLDNFRKS